MEKMSKEKFKLWLDKDKNRENLKKIAIPITALPEDDDWINDNDWDKIYEETVTNKQQ